MRLPLSYYGDPILRKKADPVETIDDDIKKLIDDMIETMHFRDGCGLAAPQVGRSIRLFIILVFTEDQNGKLITGPLEVYINPKILEVSEETEGMSEGCLSFPGLHFEDIQRPYAITVEYTDLNGNRKVQKLSGLHARQVMHENDHINGVLYIDRLSPKQRKGLDETLKKLKIKIQKLKGSVSS